MVLLLNKVNSMFDKLEKVQHIQETKVCYDC